MRESLDRALTVMLTASALIVAVSFGYRTFFAEPHAPSGLHKPARRLDAREWESALAASISLHGDRAAPVTILVFADLECPACAAFHPVVDDLIARHGDAVHFAMVHFPLPRHRFAMPAARAMECADSLGKALDWLRATYAAHDSLGIVGWGELARRAGIADTASIRGCALAGSVPARIADGRSLASTLRVSGTPTVFVDRWDFGVPSPEILDSAIVAAIRRQ